MSSPNEEDMEVPADSISQITQYKLSSSPLYLSIIANEISDMHVNW